MKIQAQKLDKQRYKAILQMSHLHGTHSAHRVEVLWHVREWCTIDKLKNITGEFSHTLGENM